MTTLQAVLMIYVFSFSIAAFTFTYARCYYMRKIMRLTFSAYDTFMLFIVNRLPTRMIALALPYLSITAYYTSQNYITPIFRYLFKHVL